MTIYSDSEDISTFTAYTGEAISAGMFVKATGTTEITTSTAIDTVDLIQVMKCNAAGDEDTAVGIAVHDAADNSYISIRTSGIFRFPIDATNGAIVAGNTVQVCGDTSAYQIELYDSTDGARPMGVALTPADTTAEYVLVAMNFVQGHPQN